MAKLPSWRRILEQDYPQQYQDLIRQLAVSINYAMDTIFQTLNRQLTFTDNIASSVGTVTVSVDASGNPKTSVSVSKTTSDTLLGVIVVKVVNQTTATNYPTSGVFVSYTETTQSIIINNITGLKANDSYSITILGLR